jgi:hypothetical protein
MTVDPPPQRRCGMIVRYRLFEHSRAQQLFGVHPGT